MNESAPGMSQARSGRPAQSFAGQRPARRLQAIPGLVQRTARAFPGGLSGVSPQVQRLLEPASHAFTPEVCTNESEGQLEPASHAFSMEMYRDESVFQR
jgi:hypothetical protein